MDNQRSNPGTSIIQIELPSDVSIFYVEGAVKTGLDALQASATFVENSGDVASSMRMNDALSAVTALYDSVRTARMQMLNGLANPEPPPAVNATFAVNPADQTPEVP